MTLNETSRVFFESDCRSILKMKKTDDNLIDAYDEDEVDFNYLVSQPTSFIILGKPFSGKSTIASKLSKDWNCPLISAKTLLLEVKETEVPHENNPDLPIERSMLKTDKDIFNLLKEKMSSPEIENSGYVLENIPSASSKYIPLPEQLTFIQKLKLQPKIIIHIKIPDEDVIKRKMNARFNPLMGTIHVLEEYNPKQKISKVPPSLPLFEDEISSVKENKKKIDTDEEPAKEETEISHEEIKQDHSEFLLLSETEIENLLIPPECLEKNVLQELEQYNLLFPYIQEYILDHKKEYVIEIDGNLPPVTLYEGLLKTLHQLALPQPVHPVRLTAFEEAQPPYDWNDIFRTICRTDPVVPLFPWRESRWLKRCPIELTNDSIINGIPSNAVNYRDKIYFLSSEEHLQQFLKNPRPFLLPPLPKHPIKFLISGHPLSGKTPVCTLLSRKFSAQVVDYGKLLQDYTDQQMEIILYNVWLNTVCQAIEDIQVRETLQQAILQESKRKLLLEERAQEEALEEGLFEMLLEEADRTGQDIEKLKKSTEYVNQIMEHLENEMEILLSKFKDRLYGISLELTESSVNTEQSETLSENRTPLYDSLEELTGIQRMLKELYLTALMSEELNEKVDAEIQLMEEPVVDIFHPSVVARVEEAENARKNEGLKVTIAEKLKLINDALEALCDNQTADRNKVRWIIDNFPAEKEVYTGLIELGWIPSSVILFLDPTVEYSVVVQRWKDLHFERLEIVSSVEYETFGLEIPEEILEDEYGEIEFAEEFGEETLEETEGEEEEKVDEMEVFKSELNELDKFFETLHEILPPDDLIDIIKININIPLEEDNVSQSTSEISQTESLQSILQDEEADHVISTEAAEFIIEGLVRSVIRISEGMDDHKTPKELLNDVVLKLRDVFCYQAKVSDKSIQEQDDEDLITTTGIINVNVNSSEEVDKDQFRQFGDARHYCPVKLKENWVLQPGLQHIEAKYRERIYRFSSEEARKKFIANPSLYTATKHPLKAPPLRLFLIGTQGSGKSIQGRFLAKAFNIFQINFRERLQEFIFAKTGCKLGFPHQVDNEQMVMDDAAMELEMQKEYKSSTLGESSKSTLLSNNTPNELTPRNTEKDLVGSINQMLAKDTSSDLKDKTTPIKLLEFTKTEQNIIEYLQQGVPLRNEVLDMVVTPWWLEEPIRSTGFVLEGFPSSMVEAQFLVKKSFFPDAVIILEVDEIDVVTRFIPHCLAQWQKMTELKRQKRAQQKWILLKRRSAAIMKRRMELEKEIKEKDSSQGHASPTNNIPNEDNNTNTEDNNILPDIDAIIAEEFPEIDDIEEVDETEEEAQSRYTSALTALYQSDEEKLSSVKELWEELHIPCYKVNGRSKPEIVAYVCRTLIAPLVDNRESIFETTQAITLDLAQRLINSGYKMQTNLGIWCPVQLQEGAFLPPYYSSTYKPLPVIHRHHVYFLSSESARSKFMLNPIKYLKHNKHKLIIPLFIAIVGPPKSGKTSLAKRFEREYQIVRLSGGDAVRYVLEKLSHTKLAAEIRSHIEDGKVMSDKLMTAAIQAALLSPHSQHRGVILDGFPLTVDHVNSMVSEQLIPFIIIELKLSLEEALIRNRLEKMSSKKHFPQHDSEEFLQLHYEAIIDSMIAMRNYYQSNHRNWVVLDANHSKWWLFQEALKHVQQCIQDVGNYITKTAEEKPVRVSHLALTPDIIRPNLGIFGQYCPVSLAIDDELVDCSRTTNFQYTLEYKGKYYDFSCEKYMEYFLADPEAYLPPSAPRLPPPFRLQPTLMTFNMIQSLNSKLSIAFGGYCPVTYLEGHQTYDSLVKGLQSYGVWYEQRTYLFASEMKREKFLRKPEKYANLKLPFKKPPEKETVNLLKIPILGYLEQTVATALIKGLTAVGNLKPKYPFLDASRSALLYIFLYLKANNELFPENIRHIYRLKLREYENRCKLLHHVCKHMKRTPFSPMPAEFNSKLNELFSLCPEENWFNSLPVFPRL